VKEELKEVDCFEVGEYFTVFKEGVTDGAEEFLKEFIRRGKSEETLRSSLLAAQERIRELEQSIRDSTVRWERITAEQEAELSQTRAELEAVKTARWSTRAFAAEKERDEARGFIDKIGDGVLKLHDERIMQRRLLARLEAALKESFAALVGAQRLLSLQAYTEPEDVSDANAVDDALARIDKIMENQKEGA
jgi:hypothetical protein